METAAYPYHIRYRVIETAKRLFNEQGYEQTSLDEIAKIAEIEERAVRYFFRSKDELLEAIWAESY